MPKLRWKAWFAQHFALVLFILMLFLSGLMFGAVLLQRIQLGALAEMEGNLAAYLSAIQTGQTWSSLEIFRHTVSQSALLLLLLWVAGMTVIGLPFLLLMIFLKGVTIGFTVASMVQFFNWQGILLAGVAVLPHHLILLPALLLVTAVALQFSFQSLKVLLFKHPFRLQPHFQRYCFTFLLAMIMVIVGSFIEGFISTRILQWGLATM